MRSSNWSGVDCFAPSIGGANARRSNSFIGACHRARLARMDSAKAEKATAHPLTRQIFSMLTSGQAHVEQGIEAFEARSKVSRKNECR